MNRILSYIAVLGLCLEPILVESRAAEGQENPFHLMRAVVSVQDRYARGDIRLLYTSDRGD